MANVEDNQEVSITAELVGPPDEMGERVQIEA